MSELSQAFEGWRKIVGRRVEDTLAGTKVESWSRQRVSVAIGAYSTLVRMDDRHDGVAVDKAHFAGPEFDELTRALRAACHACAWPVIIGLDIRRDRRWQPCDVTSLSLAGVSPRSGFDKVEAKDFDELAEASHLIARLCRPSNRPVRSWSTQSRLGGTDFVNITGYHARTEAEVVLKKLHMMNGVEALRDIAAGKPLPHGEWLTKVRFVGMDLEGLDENPLGVAATGADALAEIAASVRLLEPEATEPGL